MKALVTGAHGFMGSNLVRMLCEQGHQVRAMVRPGGDFSALEALEGLEFEMAEVDMEDPAGLRTGCEGIDVIFHLAGCTHEWNWWPVYKRINVDGTRALLDAAVDASVERFIYMSSLAVHHFRGYGEADEDAPTDGFLFTGYARSKIEAEQMVRDYDAQGKIRTVIIRPGVFPYGPNGKVHVKIFDTMAKGGWGYVNGGKALVSTVYVDNLCDGMILAAERDVALGKTYIIADDFKLTWKELSERFCEALGAPRPKLNAPLALVYPVAWVLEKIYRLFRIKTPPVLTRYAVSLAGKDFYFLPTRAEKELGYTPRVSWEEGVERTAAWYKSYAEHQARN